MEFSSEVNKSNSIRLEANRLKNSVALFYPRYSHEKIAKQGIHFHEPLSVLAVAAPLDATGYKIHIIDGRIEKNYEDSICKIADELICVGISAMTCQAPDGLKMAKFVKSHFPDIPIVWGGWHTSMFTKESIASPYVGVIVRRQGEATFAEVVSKLQKKQPLTDILGITYKEDGRVIANPERQLQDLNSFPPLPYHLLDISRYTLSKGSVHYYSSQGCPWNCAFCNVPIIFKRRYITLKFERIINDLKSLVDRYSIKRVIFVDDNFVFSKEQTKLVCQKLCAAGLNIKWEANGRIEQISRFDADLFRLLKDSGCAMIHIGVESGSPRMLDFINKGMKVEDIIKGVNLLRAYGISVQPNFIIGLPEESWQDFRLTLELIKKLNVPKVVMYQYTPVPGSPLNSLEIAKGNIEKYPDSLEEWAGRSYKLLSGISKPWLYKNDKMKRQSAIFYFCIAHLWSELKGIFQSVHLGFVYSLYQRIALFRLRHDYFSFAIDWRLFKLVYKIWRRLKY